MFSPVGKKKILIQQKFARSDENGRSPSPSARPGTGLGSPGSRSTSPSLENVNRKMRMLAPTSAIAANGVLERALQDPGMTGVVMRKILEATTRYRPQRDTIVLKAFESKTIEYSFFRQSLASAFWLSFTDEEFAAVIECFDPAHAGIVDGYSFMIAFTRLAAIRKDNEAQIVREKQDVFLRNKADEEERARIEKERRNDLAVDYEFNEASRQSALRKLELAAKNFDPYHPASPSTTAFEVKSIKPSVFKEMLKLTFNLKVDRAELGAILKEFCHDELQEVPASEFLRFFSRIGFEAREADKRKQREKQAQLDKKAEEERERKALEAKNKNQLQVDYNFSPNDEITATEKLRAGSEKYDKSATGAVALDGFDCEELSPSDFRELLKRVFNVVLTNTELGFVMHKHDIKKSGNLHCKTFLTAMLQLGRESRHKNHIEQIQKQRKLIEDAEKEHIQKMLAVQKDERVPLSNKYTDDHLQEALKKLTEAAVKFDKERGGSIESFEASHLDLVQFKRGLKRTFNLTFSAPEMGAMLEFLGVGEDKMVNCHRFLTTFTTLGAAERSRIRTEQLQRQRELDKQAKEEHERKIQENLNKTLYDVDYEFNNDERDDALRKMIESATRFDAAHPAAMSLQSFEKKFMSGPEFKEIVRRTFLLNLLPREVGALFKFFGDRAKSHGINVAFDQIDCGEFLKFFLQVGVTERAKTHRMQLEKQRKEDIERNLEHQRKVEELATRGTYQPDMKFTIEDEKSITLKLLVASEKFDKNHPAAPSLEAFDAASMSPGVFRENIKAIFGVKATPKEIGYLLSVYEKDKSGCFGTKDFLIKFFAMGKDARDAKRRESLEKQREALVQLKKEAQDKVTQLTEKSDYKIDPAFTTEDFYEAERRMVIASEKYDKMHPSAPNLDGFNGPVSPGAFRELMKRAFGIYLTPKEVGAILQRFHAEKSWDIIDGKKFIIYFIKLGFDARAQRKTQVLTEQRQTMKQVRDEQERKLLQTMQKSELALVDTYSDEQRDAAMQALINAAALYDKNAPGSVSLDSFHAKFLTPGVFREVVKRTFNVVWTAEQLAAMVSEFNNGMGNVDTNKFLVSFIKIGAEERERRKAVQLEKQRRQDVIREAKEKMKLRKAEEKMALKVNYVYTDEEKSAAFANLAAAAKRFDKAHPAAMSLQGFEEKSMKPHVFREMLKRTFSFLPSPGELGALMHYFDQKNTGEVSSHKFLVHFLKLGIAERHKEHRQSLLKLREDAIFREKFHQEKLAAQWAKAELNITYSFTEEERASAFEKLTEASGKFDPSSAGPMGLVAFQASVLSPAVFREMLKRCFNLKLTNGELAALIASFDKNGDNRIHCAEFMVTFTSLGFERRSAIRTAQLDKQRKMHEDAKVESELKVRQADSKMDDCLDHAFTDDDFNSVLEKIRTLAANYDRSHPSAPSLQGFVGTDMKPNEFKHMLMRTFGCAVTAKELTALVAYFPSKTNVTTAPGEEASARGDGRLTSSDSSSNPGTAPAGTGRRGVGPTDGVPRINNRAFLSYFNKIQREEAMKRHKARIARDREFVEQQKQQALEEQKKKMQELQELLTYSDGDEEACLQKMKIILKEYATDSAPFQEPLQGFKGPALPPDKFRDLMYRIFQIKFSFAEMGYLLSMLDHSGLGVFDGPRFLTWFYKLARVEERHLLGESDEQVTGESMRRAAKVPSTGSVPSLASSSSSFKFTARTASSKSRRDVRLSAPERRDLWVAPDSGEASPTTLAVVDPFAEAFGYEDLAEEEANAAKASTFSKATLDKSWYLPSVQYALVDEASLVDGDAVRQHLEELFGTTPASGPFDALDPTLMRSRGSVFSAVSSMTSGSFDDSLQPHVHGAKTLQALGPSRGRLRTAPAVKRSQSDKVRGVKGQLAKTDPHPRSISPEQQNYSSQSGVSSIGSEERKEREFLAKLFDDPEARMGSAAGAKRKPAILDPVQHLMNIKKHFKQAPKYVALEKMQKRKNKSKGRSLAPLKQDVEAAKQRHGGSEEGDADGTREGATGGGGFIFPMLLAGVPSPILLTSSMYDGSDEDDGDEDHGELAPDVGIVGSVSESDMDRVSLRNLLLS